MTGKGGKPESGDEVKWKPFLAAARAGNSVDQRIAAAQPIAAQVKAILSEHGALQPGSQKFFTALSIGTLNTCVASLDPEEPTSLWQLLAVNDVLAASEQRFAVVLVEHQFLNALSRLHKRIANMAHRLSQAVILVLCSTALLAGEAAGSYEGVASRPEVAELLLSHLVFLSLNPSVLLRPAGLGTAQRCLQLVWELTRVGNTPHCRGLRELLQRMDLAGRLMQLATTAVQGTGGESAAGTGEGGDGEAAAGAAADAAAAIATMAALEERRAGGGEAAAAAAASTAADGADTAAAAADPSTYEDRISLAGQACSLIANLGGLGTRGIELSASGLAPQRAWLLRRGLLAALRPPLEGLAEGLAELRRRIAAGAPAGDDEEGAARREEGEEAGASGGADGAADLRPGRMPRERLLGQVEGAVRNVLMLLGLPTIVMGRNEEEAVEGCSFVIRLAFDLFKEGYVDTMRALRDAVADPRVPGVTAAAASGPEPFTAPYPGDYGPFFRAFAGHMETVAVALGVQLEDWGVRFTGEQLARDLPVMQVNEGVDVRIAHAWLKDQIQQIIDWGHAMMRLVRMADEAKMARFAPNKGAPASAAPVAGGCAACGAAPPADGPPFQSCSKCRGVRYCSRACQVGHWPEHKAACKAAAATGQGLAAAGGVGQTAL